MLQEEKTKYAVIRIRKSTLLRLKIAALKRDVFLYELIDELSHES